MLLALASLPETALQFIIRLARMVAMTLRRARQRCAMLLGPCSLAFAALLLLPRGARALVPPRVPDALVPPRTHAAAAMQSIAPRRRRRPALHANDDKDECAPVTIKFVTGNAMKLREVEEILGMNGLPLPLEMIDIDLDELQESQPEKIAAAKARLAAEACGGPAIVDDTSLCLNAIGGMPGPYIKWFQQSKVELHRLLTDYDDKSAFAQSCIAFSPGPGAVPLVFSGVCNGTIVSPRGGSGFGWDAVFQPEGSAETFAEMSGEAKNAISHRSRALALLAQHLKGDRDLLVDLCLEYATDPVFLEDRVHYRET